MEFQTSLLYWRVVEVTFQCGSIDFVWGTRCVSLKSSFRCTSPILPGIGENGGSLAIKFHIMHIHVRPDFPPPPFFLLCGCAFPSTVLFLEEP
jgi:hypothetical protein